MNKTCQKLLREAFTAPPPLHKTEFLQRLPKRRISLIGFLYFQLGYIRRRIWVLNLSVLAAALLFAPLLAGQALWTAAALAPLMAVSLIAESGRSQRYGMSELELASRFSLRAVLFARLVILGAANLVVFAVLIFAVGRSAGISLLQAGVYLLCPYFITACLCLWTARRIRSHDGLYVCLGIAALMSAIPILHPVFNVFTEIGFSRWVLALTLSAVGAVFESAKTINQMEVSYGISH